MQVDDAAARAAEEARRRAAEEARKKAAEEAARRAAEEAARRAAEGAAGRHEAEGGLYPMGSPDEMERLTGADTRLNAYGPADSSVAGDFFAEHAGGAAKLPADQQEKLRAVVNKLCDPWTQKPQLAERTYHDLGQMLESGVLREKDASGKTIIDHLAVRMDQPLVEDIAAGLNESQKKGVIHDLIHSVANPGSISQGLDTYTCTTAVVQTLMARAMPADYVRMAAGLLWDGAGVAPTGEVIKLDTAELFERELGRKTGRGVVDAMVQGSLYEYAQATFPADGTDAAGGGRFSARYVFAGGRFSVRVVFGGEEGGGLTSQQVGGLLEKVLGVRTHDIDVSDGNRDLAWNMFVESLDRVRSGNSGLSGNQRRVQENGIPVGVQTPDGKFHQILVTERRDGKVMYLDPVDGQIHDMDEQEFKGHLRSVKVPAGAPNRFIRGDDAMDEDGSGQLDQRVLWAKMVARHGSRAMMV